MIVRILHLYHRLNPCGVSPSKNIFESLSQLSDSRGSFHLSNGVSHYFSSWLIHKLLLSLEHCSHFLHNVIVWICYYFLELNFFPLLIIICISARLLYTIVSLVAYPASLDICTHQTVVNFLHSCARLRLRIVLITS
jgi:hypothetical protein